MRRLLPLCVGFVALALSNANADEASKKAKIEEYFRLAKLDQLLNQSFTQVSNQVKSAAFQQMFGVNLAPEQRKIADELQEKVMAVVKETLSWSQLEPTYLKLYTQAFSETEIDGILAFYKSPSGQAMVSKTPQLMEQANRAVQQRMTLMQPKIQELLKEYGEKLKSSVPPKQ